MLGRVVTGASCLLLTVALVACGRDDKPAGRPGGAGAPAPVTVAAVEPSAWNDTLQSLGTAKALESVTITAKVSEIISQVHFESGQKVAAGAPLVTLRGDAQQAALASAQATFAEADRLYQRQRELAAQQLVAHSILDTQKAVRDAAQARVREMQSDVGDRNVRAPFAGVLGLRQVSPGSLVTPSTPITTLDDISSMYVDFQVPEADLASLSVGDTTTASNVAYPGREFSGKVDTIEARVDPSTRAVTVRAKFPNPDGALRPGMLLDVRIYRPERQALVIPEIAIVQVGRDSYVYRVGADDTVQRADVTVGARRAGVAEVLEGVSAGDRIVVDGTGKLRPGQKIAPSQTAKAAAPEASAP